MPDNKTLIPSITGEQEMLITEFIRQSAGLEGIPTLGYIPENGQYAPEMLEAVLPLVALGLLVEVTHKQSPRAKKLKARAFQLTKQGRLMFSECTCNNHEPVIQ